MERTTRISAFVERWQGVDASELATAQTFVMDLCDLLEVPKPHPTAEQDYMFERPVTFAHGDGTSSAGRIDCYRRGHFVLEAKKLKAGQHTKGFDDGLLRARNQGENYARALPAAEGRPPFVLVVDVGTVLEVYAEFSRTGGTYTPFPDPRSHRIALADLGQPGVLERLRLIWTDPDALDPARISAKVTREVSQQLATLARSLEQAGHASHDVAAYLSRCLFSMFAEDVELLPATSFQALLTQHRGDPATLRRMLASLWADMDRGGFSPAIVDDVLKFNGKLFKGAGADSYSLLLNAEQIDCLLAAARANWREVEPAIFGTLLERALDPAERHALGAHYTPRAYVERLVLPTVIEPLRSEWADAQAAALTLAHEAAELEASPPEANPKTKKGLDAIYRHNTEVRAKWKEARAQVQAFLHRLCTLRVLDPACGSGNFLYVTLEHLKRLEGEVLNQLDTLGDAQDSLDLGRETVTVQQLLGIELNRRAATLAELVLWIGFLQWHIRSRGRASVAEPVVHDYGNIECRDAVLAHDGAELELGDDGKPLLRWDGQTRKPHPVTGELVPDEAALVEQWRYRNPRPAQWPQADFIVGNPPFIGARKIRTALGDGYVDALREAITDVPETADFVCYWWDRSAALVASGNTRRFGLITTNSIVQSYSRPVLDRWLAPAGGVRLVFCVADHPWTLGEAAVRVSMTVGASADDQSPAYLGLVDEANSVAEDSALVVRAVPEISSSLRAEARQPEALQSNAGMCFQGVVPAGDGFKLSPEEARQLALDGSASSVIKPYILGKDLVQAPQARYIIDAHGLELEAVRSRFPGIFQWLDERVRPERAHNARPTYRDRWWMFAESRPAMRNALKGLRRFIGTPYTAKYRPFTFVDGGTLPDAMVYAIASDDALLLGTLSSQVHSLWSKRFGGSLEDRPRYNSKATFFPFPFPADDTGLTPALTERIRKLAEQIDAHRKARQAAYADVTLTGLYNVMDKLRNGEPLTAKEKTLNEHGLVGVLKSLHDELDTAVLEAYGWADLHVPTDADALLERLVTLNARRAAEEANGTVRWLRPEFQQAAGTQAALPDEEATDGATDTPAEEEGTVATLPAAKAAPARPWPAGLTEQIKVVAEVLAQSGRSLSLDEVAAHFSGRGRWRDRLPKLLDTLVALGRLHQGADGRWTDLMR